MNKLTIEEAVLALMEVPLVIKLHTEKRKNEFNNKVISRYIQNKIDYDWVEIIFDENNALNWTMFNRYLTCIKNKNYELAKLQAFEWYNSLKI